MFCFPCRRLHPSSSACPITQDCRFPFPIPVEAANGGSTYSETWAFVFNALFYPLPSSCCLCWPDVLVCEAEVLCGLPRGEDSEVRTCRASLRNPECGRSTAGCCHFHRLSCWLVVLPAAAAGIG